MGFYQYKKIGKGTANINEYLSSEFLLEGKKKAVLMDTGDNGCKLAFSSGSLKRKS